jgi:hypothetical protein
LYANVKVTIDVLQHLGFMYVRLNNLNADSEYEVCIYVGKEQMNMLNLSSNSCFN